MSVVKFLNCYWTTSNNPVISEIQKISGYILIANSGLILGTVKDYVGNAYGEHIVCGSILNQKISIVDIMDFRFQSSHCYQFPIDNTIDFNENYELMGTGYSIGYVTCGKNPSKLRVEMLPFTNEFDSEYVLNQIKEVIKRMDPRSVLYFKKIFEAINQKLEGKISEQECFRSYYLKEEDYKLSDKTALFDFEKEYKRKMKIEDY